MIDVNDDVLLRNNLRPTEVLRFTAREWSAFCKRAVRGDFD